MEELLRLELFLDKLKDDLEQNAIFRNSLASNIADIQAKIEKERLNATPVGKWLNKCHHGDAAEIMSQMPEGEVSLIITSPPYNIGRGYDSYNDSMVEDDFIDWQILCLKQMMRILSVNGAIFYNYKQRIKNGILSRTFDKILESFPVRQKIIWKRPSSPNHNPAFFAPLSEIIALIAMPDFKLVPRANALGDVWEIPFKTNGKSKYPHPAPFPLELPLRAIRSIDAKIILDPFMGSGTTAQAAWTLGRDWIGIDNSQKYCDMTNERIAKSIFSESF